MYKMLITKEQFLEKFNGDEIDTFDDFIDTYTVRIRNNTTPLKEYILRKNISKKPLETLYSHVVERDKYLTRFYNTSLLVNDNIHIRAEPMKKEHMNNNKNVNYKNIIRNIHCEDILENTYSGIENNPTFLKVLYDIYINRVIDYKILTPSALHYIVNGRIGSVYSSFYFRASIMNPYLVYSLNKSLLKGTKVFTPTLGWSSYAYGFMECDEIIEYVGTDVIHNVCSKTRAFLKQNYKDKMYKIFKSPSENLMKNSKFREKYDSHFDLVFFSPPYFKLEMYPGNKQSTSNYNNYDQWLKKYWEKTIQLCLHVLEPGGKLCYILSGYGNKNSKDSYNLIDDMNKITGKYFSLLHVLPLHNKNVHVTEHRETAEKIIIFYKK
jgi:hypothetical protein